MAVLLKELMFLAILASALTFPSKPTGKSKNSLLICLIKISKIGVYYLIFNGDLVIFKKYF